MDQILLHEATYHIGSSTSQDSLVLEKALESKWGVHTAASKKKYHNNTEKILWGGIPRGFLMSNII